jgi:putative spermidine/putrescine transport system ATP-binding protein
MSGLAIRRLNKMFATFAAVADVELDVAEGEFVSLLGPSGCGKTTTLRCVAGLEAPTSGRILFGERDVTGLPTEKRNIGMVFQNYALFPHMTVAENIRFGLEMRSVRGAEALRRVDEVMEMVQLTGFQARYPRELSGGQQQRVALARALVVEPSMLLLDEPLANLDAKLRDEMRFFIRTLQQRVGITTLYVTHDQSESMTMSDRIVVMFGGRIHQVGTPQEIYFRPSGKDVANFIGQSNLFTGTVMGRDGTSVTVETPAGPIRCEAPAGVAQGTRANVMIRPEAITIAVRASDTGLPARIVETHFLGSIVDYRVALIDGTIVAVQAMGKETHPVGEAVSLDVDHRKAWLLT